MLKYHVAVCDDEKSDLDGIVLGDISFCSTDIVDELIKAGFSERLYFGSDFPIMDYLYGKRDNGIGNLTKVYSGLLETWQSYRFTINMTHALKR